eukprot:CAMPEP_0114542276 /NCGR_PEP_ID=MMETSP0114-20121206/1754_1 /TAXON_ID=31324 /ORGANISM="Goniomonas sp, Strain m" /LENGTH=133 /DNA_ID=CAMNT_0001726573 /DNA_START=15 /DNA_END=416 /DNA_ORIENTATION=+
MEQHFSLARLDITGLVNGNGDAVKAGDGGPVQHSQKVYCGVGSCGIFGQCQSCDELSHALAVDQGFANSAGEAVFCGTDHWCRTYYCGLPKDIPGTDGFCGPNNGPQCGDCAKFKYELAKPKAFTKAAAVSDK